MDKPQLMEYLKAVCNGEAALYACNETMDALRRQMNAIPEKLPKPALPTMHLHLPEREMPKQGNFGDVIKWLIKIIVAFLVFWVMWKITETSTSVAAAFLRIGSGVVAYFLTGHFIKNQVASANEKAYQKECNAAKDAAKSQYEREIQIFNWEINDIEFKEEKNKIIREGLRAVIAENERTGERIRKELKRLYDRNIIHEKFRSMVAVTQIYEYLDVGVCSTLEGADGAYAMYYNDIRTEKICDGIQQLKTAMQRGLSKLMASQNTMCQLLSDTNNSIRQMDTSLQAKIAALQSEVGRVSDGVSDGVSGLRDSVLDSAAAANKQREEIRRILSTAAHNQYVEQREKGMSTWLLRNPY